MFTPEVLDGLTCFVPATTRSDATHVSIIKKFNLGPDATNASRYDKIPVIVWTAGYDTDPMRPPDPPETPMDEVRRLPEGHMVQAAW